MMDNKVKQRLSMGVYIYVCMSLDQQLSIVTVDMKIMYGHAKYSLQLHFKDHNNFLDY